MIFAPPVVQLAPEVAFDKNSFPFFFGFAFEWKNSYDFSSDWIKIWNCGDAAVR